MPTRTQTSVNNYLVMLLACTPLKTHSVGDFSLICIYYGDQIHAVAAGRADCRVESVYMKHQVTVTYWESQSTWNARWHTHTQNYLSVWSGFWSVWYTHTHCLELSVKLNLCVCYGLSVHGQLKCLVWCVCVSGSLEQVACVLTVLMGHEAAGLHFVDS